MTYCFILAIWIFLDIKSEVFDNVAGKCIVRVILLFTSYFLERKVELYIYINFLCNVHDICQANNLQNIIEYQFSVRFVSTNDATLQFKHNLNKPIFIQPYKTLYSYYIISLTPGCLGIPL